MMIPEALEIVKKMFPLWTVICTVSQGEYFFHDEQSRSEMTFQISLLDGNRHCKQWRAESFESAIASIHGWEREFLPEDLVI